MSEYKINRSNKVTFKLTPIDLSIKKDGKNKTRELDITGIRDEQTNLWHFQFPNGITPSVLVQSQFTNFNKLLDFGTRYFSNRNLKIKDIING